MQHGMTVLNRHPVCVVIWDGNIWLPSHLLTSASAAFFWVFIFLREKREIDRFWGDLRATYINITLYKCALVLIMCCILVHIFILARECRWWDPLQIQQKCLFFRSLHYIYIQLHQRSRLRYSVLSRSGHQLLILRL